MSLRRAVILCALLLTGCEKPLTNQQIVDAVKFCQSNHMKAEFFAGGLRDLEITKVQCGL